MKLAIIIALSLLSGCAIYNERSVPMSVLVMPNDCANSTAIESWLTRQIEQERALLTSQEQYNETQIALKYKLWTLRYNCNR